MNAKWIDPVDSGRGRLVILMLIPAVVYSILVLDIFWSLASLITIILVFLPRLMRTKPLPFPVAFALLSTFLPFALGRLIGLDSQTALVLGMFLQTWFIYFFSLACLVMIRDWFWTQLMPNFTVFLTVITSISLSTCLAILSFVADRIFSSQLLPSNLFLMLQLSMSFFGSIFLGLMTARYIRRVAPSSQDVTNRRPVED